MTEELEEYILRHIDAEPSALHRLHRNVNLRLHCGRMSSGHLQGRLLKMFVRMIQPQNILELGTFGSYAAQCMAEGMSAGAQLHTIEIFDELEPFIREHLADCPDADRIHLHIGDAAQILPTMGDMRFQLVFIDANKRNYSEYYRMVMPLLSPGGFIVADNTLWDGHVVDTAYDRDPQTKALREFNAMVAADPAVEKVIIPIRDGLTVIYKKPFSPRDVI